MKGAEATARMTVDLYVSERRARGQVHEITRRAQLFMRAGLPLEDVLDALKISRATWYRRVDAATRWEQAPGGLWDKDEYATTLAAWLYEDGREELARLEAYQAGREEPSQEEIEKWKRLAEERRDMRDVEGGRWVWVQDDGPEPSSAPGDPDDPRLLAGRGDAEWRR